MGFKHAYFIARTVLIRNGNFEEALRSVNQLCSSEDILGGYRRSRRYEKPYMVRRRINSERCRAILDEDMTRKVHFLGRTNRKDPYPAC